jgi:hypothetical protein
LGRKAEGLDLAEAYMHNRIPQVLLLCALAAAAAPSKHQQAPATMDQMACPWRVMSRTEPLGQALVRLRIAHVHFILDPYPSAAFGNLLFLAPTTGA